MLKSIKDLYFKVRDKCSEKQKAKTEDCNHKDLSRTGLEINEISNPE